jgi:lipopolysaccharide cholinephosphotransferase
MTNEYGNELLHKVLLSAMKDIDSICRANGLRYYLHAGTLLGAFNHQGFIPWDDDVDISLMREDYEKLLQILEEQYQDRYFVHNYKTDPDYKNNRTVLRILGTRVHHFHEDSANKHPEIAVDLVPLDSAPDKAWQRRLQQTLIWIFDAAVQIKQGDIIPQSIPTKMLSLLSFVNRVRLGRIIDALTTHYNGKKTAYVGLLSYTGKNPYTGISGYENDLIDRESYEHPITVPFEDTEFMTIGDPIKDLEHRYGPKWHEPYPEEKRVTKHDVQSYEISPEVRKRIGI